MVTTTRPAVHPSNAEQARAWDGDEGSYWAERADAFDASMARYQAPLLDAASIGRSERVLDIGCGTGRTTRDAARRAASGWALGVDLSAAMLDVARRRAWREGLRNVTFVQADAQVHPFEEASFDLALSRAGAMFFGDPVAAFGNIARALRPGGRLVLLVWQPVERNDWIGEISGALRAGEPLPAPPPGAPGPFSLGDPARVRAILGAAGFTEPDLAGLAEPLTFGRDPDEACTFILGLTGWMLEGQEEPARAAALSALRRTVERHHTEAGVQFGSAAWLVTARRG